MAVKYNTSLVTDGLVSYYDAANPRSYPGTGNTWFDLVGGNDLSRYGNPIYNDTYFTFSNSVNDYFMIDSFSCPTATVTFMCAFRVTSFSGAQTPFTYSVAGNNEMLLFLSNNTTATPYVKGSGAGLTVDAMQGRWIIFHWASNRSTGAETYYMNNDVIGTRSYAAGTLITTGGYLIIGQESDAPGGGFDPAQNLDGDFAIMSVYNKTLSQSEVSQNYAALRGRYEI